MKTLLAFAGSSRLNSLNQALLNCAVHLAREKGAVVETIDLKALDLPVYDGDYEASNGLPQGAVSLKAAMWEENIGVTVVPTVAAVGGASEMVLKDSGFAASNNGRRVIATLNALLSLNA